MSVSRPGVLELIAAVRELFHELGAASHAQAAAGLTASMREVLGSIDARGPGTVPDIARRKGVSRQHIQRLVDELLDRRLVLLEDNPAHLRSPRVALSAQGARVARAIAERELGVAERLARGLSPSDTAAALRALGTLRGNLAALLHARHGSQHGGKQQ